MGVVWRAEHTTLGTRAAIKFLNRAMGEEPAARFVREARMAAKLQSPHLARVFDCAQLETGELFIVMEYFSGEGLDARLRRKGPLPVSEAVGYIMQACVGLAVAHRNDIVHRDIKPANLFLADTDDGEREIKIVDFGLSRLALAEDGEGLTQDQMLLGTPEYAPPEQFGNATSARVPADIWSLGATLYCLLCDEPPFPKDPNLGGLYQISDLLDRVTGKDPKSLCERREEVPRSLEKVILKCLEKKPEDRYPNVADLASDLAGFGADDAEDVAQEAALALRGGRRARSSRPAPPPASSRVTALSDEKPAPEPEPSDHEEAARCPASPPSKEASDGSATRLFVAGIVAVVAFGLIVWLVVG